MIFRNIKQAELKEIMALYRAVIGTEFCTWNELYPGDIELKMDFESNNLFVMTDECRIVGGLSIVAEKELEDLPFWKVNENVAEIARVAVLPNQQGKGIGSKMIQSIEKILEDRGCKAIHLIVDYHNVPAQKIYRKNGFKFLGECDMYGHHYFACEKEIYGKN